MSRYEMLKDKYKSIARYVDFRKQAINKITSVYEWDGVADYIPPYMTPQWIEYKLLKYGIMALGEIEGELTFVLGNFAGEPDKRFGLPHTFRYYTNGGLTGDWEIGKDCAVVFANPSIYPDIFTIDRYCKMLSDVDLSIECMLIYARDLPIPIVQSDPEKSAIEHAIKDIREGKMSVVKAFDPELLKTLDITKPENIQYMTNYNLLHDELMKRLFLEFGIAIDNKDKKAQLTTEELDAFSQVAGAAFYSRYKLRKKFAEDANKLFNINITVKPFEYFDDLSNGRNEDFAEDTRTEETNDTPEQIEETTEEPADETTEENKESEE